MNALLRIAFLTALCGVFAAPAPAADIAPVIAWPVNVGGDYQGKDLTIRRGETVILQPTYLQGTNPVNLSAVTSVVLRYRPAGATFYFACTGAVYQAAAGQTRIRWTPAQESTQRVYQYEIGVMSPDAVLLRAWGNLTLDGGLGNAVSVPPAIHDWGYIPATQPGDIPGDIAPVLGWPVAVDQYKACDLTIRHGETVILQPRFVQGTNAVDLSAATAVVLRYGPTAASTCYALGGYVEYAPGGLARIRWTPAAEPSNAVSRYEIAVMSADATLLRAFGTLKIDDGLSPASSGLPATATSIDWSLISNANPGNAPFPTYGWVTNFWITHASAATGLIWGSLSGSISNQADLMTLLRPKAETDPVWVAAIPTVARTCGRVLLTNWSATISGGTWSNGIAQFPSTGALTIAVSQPISAWYYDATPGAYVLVDQVNAGGDWTNQTHGLLYTTNVTAVRICVTSLGIPTPGGITNPVTISNLRLFCWSNPLHVGDTNCFAGTVTTADDPRSPSEVATRNYVDRTAAAIHGDASQWANWDASGKPYHGGVSMSGRRLQLSSEFSLLADGGMWAVSGPSAPKFAIQYHGVDVFFCTASNTPLHVSTFQVGSGEIAFGVATNGVTQPPRIECASNLMAGAWSTPALLSSTWPAATGGVYGLTISNVFGRGMFFRAVQTATGSVEVVTTAPLRAAGGLNLGGVTRTAWPSAGTWGEIGGTLSNQADLRMALANIALTPGPAGKDGITTNIVTIVPQTNVVTVEAQTNVVNLTLTNFTITIVTNINNFTSTSTLTNLVTIGAQTSTVNVVVTNATSITLAPQTNTVSVTIQPQTNTVTVSVLPSTNQVIVTNILTVLNTVIVTNVSLQGPPGTNGAALGSLVLSNAPIGSSTITNGVLTLCTNGISGVPAYTNPALATLQNSGGGAYWQTVYVNYQQNLRVLYNWTTNFYYSGSVTQTWTVPVGVSNIMVKVWGAGGGGAYKGDATGSDGGFASIVLGINNGDVLYILVGGGGSAGGTQPGVSGLGGFPGGGYSATNGCSGTGNQGAGGGGYSAVSLNSITNIVCLGAGGGGGGGGNYSTGSSGGAGGGTTGNDGGIAQSSSSARGGSQIMGGAGGTLTGYPLCSGSSGSSLQGGSCTNAGGTYTIRGGGGGAGYFGGGGGIAGSGLQTGGGAGGSCYAPGGYIIRGRNPLDEDYPGGYGSGGTAGASPTAGSAGLVIIKYYYNP